MGRTCLALALVVFIVCISGAPIVEEHVTTLDAVSGTASKAHSDLPALQEENQKLLQEEKQAELGDAKGKPAKKKGPELTDKHQPYSMEQLCRLHVYGVRKKADPVTIKKKKGCKKGKQKGQTAKQIKEAAQLTKEMVKDKGTEKLSKDDWKDKKIEIRSELKALRTKILTPKPVKIAVKLDEQERLFAKNMANWKQTVKTAAKVAHLKERDVPAIKAVIVKGKPCKKKKKPDFIFTNAKGDKLLTPRL